MKRMGFPKLVAAGTNSLLKVSRPDPGPAWAKITAPRTSAFFPDSCCDTQVASSFWRDVAFDPPTRLMPMNSIPLEKKAKFSGRLDCRSTGDGVHGQY